MSAVTWESYLISTFKMAFKGGEGVGKSDVKRYVVPNCRCMIIQRPLDELKRDPRLLQKIVVRSTYVGLDKSALRCVVIK